MPVRCDIATLTGFSRGQVKTPSCGYPYASDSVSQAVLDSRHATDGEAQEYLDARIEALEGIVQELEEVAGRLHLATRATAG